MYKLINNLKTKKLVDEIVKNNKIYVTGKRYTELYNNENHIAM